mmetsp:Transcript_7562/g.9108  ORF Transcript_7562/g.9108 Transcript_7562/m.9108 type:complete len:158 (-) Transcript_7562:332-805(-)
MGKKYYIQLRLEDRNSHEAFVAAARNGDLVSIIRFLREGVDVNATSLKGDTALFWAACEGHTKIVKLLLDQDRIDVNMKTKNNIEWTPLMAASVYGKGNIVQLLLKHPDINVNITDRNRKPAIFLASEEGNLDIVRTLLQCNDLNTSFRTRVIEGVW